MAAIKQLLTMGADCLKKSDFLDRTKATICQTYPSIHKIICNLAIFSSSY